MIVSTKPNSSGDSISEEERTRGTRRLLPACSIRLTRSASRLGCTHKTSGWCSSSARRYQSRVVRERWWLERISLRPCCRYTPNGGDRSEGAFTSSPRRTAIRERRKDKRQPPRSQSRNACSTATDGRDRQSRNGVPDVPLVAAGILDQLRRSNRSGASRTRALSRIGHLSAVVPNVLP